MRHAIALLVFTTACVADVAGESIPELDNDPDLAALADDPMPEIAAADTAGLEAAAATAPISADAKIACTRTRYLHVSNFSFVAPVSECVNGECPNGCWGVQRRTSGFACDYDATAPGYVATRDGGGPFASYNEIKPLDAHDATAVASCKAQSGGRAMRTYTVWNGAGWDDEGIAAGVSFAELYGPQAEALTEFAPWFASYRGRFAPMANVSPETGLTFVETERTVAKICEATRDHWLGIYFYNSSAPMADWKREAIIRAMNYCTTH
jgi:hypothetical protein